MTDVMYVVLAIVIFFNVLWIIAWKAEGRDRKKPKTTKPSASG